MKMSRSIFIAILVLVTVILLRPVAAPQSENLGRCIVNIPSDWGTYRGDAQGYGLVFEDTAGTLRFVKQLPCGLEGTPNVLVEVHRK